MPSTPEQIQQDLWQRAEARGGALYAILDGAHDKRIYPNVLLAGARYECLYRGRIPEKLAKAAPYLLELRPNTDFTNWLFKYGWGDSWGIFLTSSASFDILRRHFRRFLKVRDHRGKRLYFRFYDLRVLRVYLPTCNKHERDYVFGPVEGFHVETEDATTVRDYTRSDVGLPRHVLSKADGIGSMLVVRSDQMEALKRAAQKQFEHRMVVQLNECFPEQCEALGDSMTREVIRHGIKQAEQYGIEYRQDLGTYINLMFIFGRDFDIQRYGDAAQRRPQPAQPREARRRFSDRLLVGGSQEDSETISKESCHPERSPTASGAAEGSRPFGLARPLRRDLLRQSASPRVSTPFSRSE